MELEPWQDLSGKIVMVTGASSGIGKELCLDLAKAGCMIIAAARRTDRLNTLCDHINQLSSFPGHQERAVAVELDLRSDEPAIEAAINDAWKAFGRIDALINCAGIRGTLHSPLDLSREEWDSVMKTNMRDDGHGARGHKIKVNAASPGLFESEITKDLMQKPWIHNVALNMVPLRSWVQH